MKRAQLGGSGAWPLQENFEFYTWDHSGDEIANPQAFQSHSQTQSFSPYSSSSDKTELTQS